MASPFTIIFTILLLHLFQTKGVTAATFTFVNRCQQVIWPATLGTPALDTTGFELPKGGSRALQAPTGWSGRFWGRTGCTFDESGRGTCQTGDCGSGQIECNGAGATATTLAEFTLGSGSMDFYDVSLVDGFNLPMMVDASGGSGQCTSTGCAEDLNQRCPAELRTEGGGACRSACSAFNTAEYCCTGAYASPATCKPSMYSKIFKSSCPEAYSYAYDDGTSTFTCTAADYVITFCPNRPRKKSLRSNDDNKKPIGSGSGPGIRSGSGNETTSGSGSDPGTGSVSGNEATHGSRSGSGSDEEAALLVEGTRLADFANGESRSSQPSGAPLLVVMLIGVVHFCAARIPLEL